MTDRSPYRPRVGPVEMYRRELSERAALLRRLGYSRERAEARLQANVAWDFEVGTGAPPDELGPGAIRDIVDAAYAHRASS